MSARQGKRRSLRPLRVELGERSYSIRIGLEGWEGFGEAVARQTGAQRAILVTSPTVGRLHASKFLRSLRSAGLAPKRLEIPDGDRHKSLATVAKLYDELVRARVDRATALVALGGGVVGDMVGFAAATYLRGVPFVQVPTTLLAMVDASVGGKTGVNLPSGKNLVGAFYQPRLVWVEAATLETLPRRLRAAGMAEVIKHAAIWDRAHFRELERDVARALDLDPATLLRIVRTSCSIKAAVVARDERESGLRMLLNFGHTLGHAVEALSRYRTEHGEAVAIGMNFAAERSEQLGHSPAGTQARLRELLSRAELPTELPRYPRRAYLDALRVDKKRTASRIRFVVLRGIGRATTVPLLPTEILPARRRVG